MICLQSAPRELGLYYVSTQQTMHNIAKGCYAKVPFDKNEIPVVDYGSWRGMSPGPRYNPTIISQYGLGLHARHVAKACGVVQREILRQGNWLADHLNNGKWPYMFDLQSRNLTTGWISAMTQGQAISFLLRLFQVTLDEKFRDASTLALSPLFAEISAGGVFLWISTDRGSKSTLKIPQATF